MPAAGTPSFKNWTVAVDWLKSRPEIRLKQKQFSSGNYYGSHTPPNTPISPEKLAEEARVLFRARPLAGISIDFSRIPQLTPDRREWKVSEISVWFTLKTGRGGGLTNWPITWREMVKEDVPFDHVISQIATRLQRAGSPGITPGYNEAQQTIQDFRTSPGYETVKAIFDGFLSRVFFTPPPEEEMHTITGWNESRPMNEEEMSREELVRELAKASEDTAAMELAGVIAQAQLQSARSARPLQRSTPPPKAAP